MKLLSTQVFQSLLPSYSPRPLLILLESSLYILLIYFSPILFPPFFFHTLTWTHALTHLTFSREFSFFSSLILLDYSFCCRFNFVVGSFCLRLLDALCGRYTYILSIVNDSLFFCLSTFFSKLRL